MKTNYPRDYMTIVASAPVKVILFGEHAVVYGYPSIAAALNLYVHVKLRKITSSDYLVVKSNSYKLEWKADSTPPPPFLPLNRIIDIIEEKCDFSVRNKGIYVEISSDVPPACGLGTSAACSVAFTSALLTYLGLDIEKSLINTYAYEAEKISHGTPSGIDNTISTYGGLILYTKNKDPPFESLENIPDINIILVDSGIPRNTKRAVMLVANLLKKYGVIRNILEIIGNLTEMAWTELKKGKDADIRLLGEYMNINHGLLSAIGVSSQMLEDIVYTLRKSGAYGSKITGAGLGGFVVGIVDNNNLHNLKRSLRKKGYSFYISKINKYGVSVRQYKKFVA